MELFTLGEGNGYSERDVREQARALTGFANDWRRGAGPSTSASTRSGTTAGEDASSASAAPTTGATRASSASGTRSTPAFFVDKLWSYFIPARAGPRRPGARSRRCTATATRSGPVLEAILRHPPLYDGPRMVKPPVVYIAGLLRALGRGVDTHAWVWLSTHVRAAALLPAERRGLGRRALARHRDLPRPLGVANDAHASVRARTTSRPPTLPTEPEALVEGAIDVLGHADAPARDARRCSRSRRGAMGDADATGSETSYRSSSRTPCGSSRRVPRPPDL